jgi:ATP-binding cassette subfamily B protein
MRNAMPKNLTAFIWYFMRRHMAAVIGFLIITVIGSLEIALSPYVLKIIIDTATQTAENSKAFLNAVTYFAVFYVLLTFIHNIAMRAYHYICLKLFPKLRTEISIALFDHLTEHSVSYFQRNFSGDLANKVQNVSDSVESIIQNINRYVVANVVTLSISLILLATVHVFFAVVLLLWGIAYVLNGYAMAKKTARIAHQFSHSNSFLTGQLVDSISNILSAKIFSNVSFEKGRIDEAVNTVGDQDKLLQKQVMWTDFYQNIIFTALIACLMAGLIYGRVHGLITVGDFAFILSLSITIAMMVNGLTKVMPNLAMDIGKCQQALNTIIVPYDILDIKNTPPIDMTGGEINFKEVNFSYDKNPLFQNFNLKIPAKQKVGLVGFSGAGKTTLINLLFRLYEIQQGEIAIDGQNINAVNRDSLIKNIALIPQHPELFHRSLMDNIRYGDTTASDEAVYRAAKLAQCHEFISRLPEGYQAMVGEKGIKLSGGQRQRIAIARAILKDAPILILDEATSALDSATEREIQDALRVVMADKTVIVIAHRLSTILAMDRILFFDAGKIVEDGSPGELREENGHFSTLLEMQKVD